MSTTTNNTGSSGLIVSATNDPELIVQALTLRHEVFIEEFGRHREEDRDHYDATAQHVVALLNGEVVGTLRAYVLDEAPGQLKIGRVAVRHDLRGRGIGRLLMDAVHAWAAEQGWAECYLHAAENAVGFYDKLGYVRQGDWFMEAGIRHMRLTYDLRQSKVN